MGSRGREQTQRLEGRGILNAVSQSWLGQAACMKLSKSTPLL